jgi:tetratricopeptide (TPR) repeat protein
MLHRPSNLFAVCAALLISTAAGKTSEVAELNAAQLQQQGAEAYKRADYAAATRFFAARARLAPEDATVYYYLGNCYMQIKQPGQAAHMYSACVRLAPTSQAGQFALSALEQLSSAPKPAASAETGTTPEASASATAVAAAYAALPSKRPVDQSYNDAIRRIKAERPTIKVQVDQIWQQLQDSLANISPRSRNYAIDLERVRREGELALEELQLKELRHESRVLAPDKIDARAVPELPKEDIDDSKNALGVLGDYYKPDKPFDPFDMNLSPEITANFLTIRDVFGDLKTYDANAIRMAQQLFVQLKRTVENKEDSFDQQVMRLKRDLLRDIIASEMASGSSLYGQQTIAYQMSIAKMPRADNDANLTPIAREVSDLTERTKKRIKEMQSSYDKDVDMASTGAKEQLVSLVASGLGSQLKHVSGKIQLVPLGTDLRTRNYVNFADSSDTAPKMLIKTPVVQPLKAKALKMQPADAATVTGGSK